jgi:hypothetical protein
MFQSIFLAYSRVNVGGLKNQGFKCLLALPTGAQELLPKPPVLMYWGACWHPPVLMYGGKIKIKKIKKIKLSIE